MNLYDFRNFQVHLLNSLKGESDMNELQSALEQEVYAVVGASNNKDKYGYKVFKFLENHNIKVYPINPNASQIEGTNCYGKLSELPEKIDVVVTVVPPQISKKIAEEAGALEIEYLWMQPGSEFENAELYCEKLGLKCIVNECIMVEMRG